MDETRIKEFVDKYSELCKEYNLQIIAIPEYKLRDDGTFSLVLKYTISELPKVGG